MNEFTRAPVRETFAPTTAIENVAPQVDGGRFAVKRTAGEEIVVSADCFAHGHERVACEVRYRGPGDTQWARVAMQALGNDRWSARFTVDRIGAWQYGIVCWVDHLATWREAFLRRVEADDIRVSALAGAELAAESVANADGPAREQLVGWARQLRDEQDPQRLRGLAMDDALLELAQQHAPRAGASQTVSFPAWVDRERARCGAWYEAFPRSMAAVPGTHGTFADLERNLERIARHGLRRALPAAHPPHRPHAPQGPQQRHRLGGGRRRQPLGASARARAGTPPSTPSWAQPRISGASSGRHARATWRSRSTSHSSARPTIRGSRSIPSGSGAAPTAACSTRRTRPRSTRTSTRSTSRRATGERSGRRCAR